jgi:multidrug resistance efflux pump
MEDLLSASRERDGINEQLTKADKRHKAVQMVAPADGVVLEIGKLSVGSIVREAEPLFTWCRWAPSWKPKCRSIRWTSALSSRARRCT